MSINKIILVGNLGQDPEIKTLNGGSRVCNASIATSETLKNKDGSKGEETTWHDIEIWDKRADAFHEYMQKGSKVYVEGRLKKNKNEESGVWYTKVKVDDWQFMDGKPTGSDKPVTDDIPF